MRVPLTHACLPKNLLLQAPEADLVSSGHPALIPQLKVGDFGFARHLEAASLAETLCGSPLYMAPEILRYEKYDAKADLWSVGAVLYEMCVGRPPFRAANHVELLRRIEKGEDKIKFPDERSEESLRREQMRRAEDGKDADEVVRAHTVDEDLKQLIRALLKQKPVQRMTFESFFHCDVIEDGKKGAARSLRSSSSSLHNSTTPVATRVAPSVPSSRQGSSNDLAKLVVLQPSKANQDPPTPSPQATTPLRSYFKPKYIVGGERAGSTRTGRQDDKVQPKTPGRDQPSEAGEASSLEDNVLETPGSSVSHLPPAAAAETEAAVGPGQAAVKGHKLMLDEDKGYVMVEKRNVEVNALADGIADANLAKAADEQRGAWGPLSVVRRPSRLGRLASGLGSVATASISPTASSSPSSPQPQRVGQVSPTSVASSRLATTPPNAPFAIPPGARGVAFHRRSSQTNEGLPLSRANASQQQVALVPSSAPTTTGTGSPSSFTSPSQALSPSSSALARAISMASVRLFGVPTGMSLRSASIRRSLRLGLGAGALLSSSPGNAIESQSSDPAEQNLLNLLHDYGQKSFVLSEFADSKLSYFYSEGPHQGNYYDGGRHASSSSISSVGIGVRGVAATAHSTSNSSSVSSEVVAAEALILYVRSLSFLQRGIDATRDYLEARTTRYSSAYQASAEVNEAVQWLRAKFNDGYERASFARSKASEEMPDSAQNVDKMIFDKALEIARGAALDELGSNRDVSDQSWNADKCLLAYETASSMLMALLDPGEDEMDLSDGSTGTIEKFVKSIQKRMASLQRKYESAPSAS